MHHVLTFLRLVGDTTSSSDDEYVPVTWSSSWSRAFLAAGDSRIDFLKRRPRKFLKWFLIAPWAFRVLPKKLEQQSASVTTRSTNVDSNPYRRFRPVQENSKMGKRIGKKAWFWCKLSTRGIVPNCNARKGVPGFPTGRVPLLGLRNWHCTTNFSISETLALLIVNQPK